MKPTVGRVVHYTNLGDKDGKYPPEQQAAIITGVKDRGMKDFNAPEETAWVVDLHIFYRTGDFHMLDVPYSEEYERGHWSWPPRA